jgi:hypothetical protein
VTTFDVISQFHLLLSDPVLNVPENLVVNPDDAFSRYPPPGGLWNECLSSSWYRNARAHMEEAGPGDFKIPIILYIDKTQMSISGKLIAFFQSKCL